MRPDMTAREEASTVIEGVTDGVLNKLPLSFGGDGAGVGYGLIEAVALCMLIKMRLSQSTCIGREGSLAC
jgi:hypothetical protein